MGLNAFTYFKYEDLLDDELVKTAIEKLRERRERLVQWQKDNDPLEECPECGSEDIQYKWNKRICNNCGYEEDYHVPTGKGGITASRKLESVIKEFFGNRMAVRKRKQKPNKSDLKHLPISIDKFDTGEYTESEMKFLVKRFEDYVDSLGTIEPNDEFMIHSLVLQELKIKKLFRQEALNPDEVDSLDKKRELDVYNNLAKELKSTKATREGDETKDVIQEVISDFKDDEEIDKLMEEHKKEKEERNKKLKEIEKEKDVNNPYYGTRS
ncbi:MAG: hypothetical protein ACOC1K_01080 [Nanoarchaeota archaeon]